MTTLQQKETERFYVKRYLAFAGFSGGIIDRERPDFAVVGAHRIGVEVTECHQPALDGDRFSRTAC